MRKPFIESTNPFIAARLPPVTPPTTVLISALKRAARGGADDVNQCLSADNGPQVVASISAFREPLRPTVCVGEGHQNSVVGIATLYGPGGRGIESRWERDFTQPSRQALAPTQLPVQWVSDLFPGVKRPGRGFDHPPPSSAEVKERVQLYLYSPSWPSWPVLGLTLLFLLVCYIFILLQGEHKVFPWLQTFIKRKLRGIQTFFFQNVTQLKKFFYN
jgi:hypothetical protein